MSDYRRYFVAGGTYFFTLVTYGRRPIFANDSARKILGSVMRSAAAEMPFETVALVLLPDHLHALWSLPPGDDDYSQRWKTIKDGFTTAWLASGGTEAMVTPSQRHRGHRGIWQRRFWEHTIRDETDLENHADYIHYNPVKHQLARRPADWQPSTFHRFVSLGHYPINWGSTEPVNIKEMNLE